MNFVFKLIDGKKNLFMNHVINQNCMQLIANIFSSNLKWSEIILVIKLQNHVFNQFIKNISLVQHFKMGSLITVCGFAVSSFRYLHLLGKKIRSDGTDVAKAALRVYDNSINSNSSKWDNEKIFSVKIIKIIELWNRPRDTARFNFFPFY